MNLKSYLLFVITLTLFSLEGTIASARQTPITSPATELHCDDLCPRERHPSKSQRIVVRETHSVATDPPTKLARWVSYKVTVQGITVHQGIKRPRNWAADPALADWETLEPNDYKGAHATHGYDRGHLAPLASLGALSSWRALNYLSNIAPQKTTLNGGVWEKLEAAERRLAQRWGVLAVMVITGPLYEKRMPALPAANERHQVPSGYWKIITLETTAGRERAAFIFEQDVRPKTGICSGLVTITEIEKRAGLILPTQKGHAPLNRRLGCRH